MILEAYHLSQYQLSGGPRWLESERYSIEAKADSPANEDQLRSMLQTLLRQRFQLTVHRDSRQMQVYALTVNKSGLKLLELQEGEPMPSGKELISHGFVLPKLDRVAGVLSTRKTGRELTPSRQPASVPDRPSKYNGIE